MGENLFKSGQHPMTGEKAMRATVYELLQQIKGVEFSPIDIVGLIPTAKQESVASALRGLSKNPDAYPGVHRLSRGRYIFDPTKAQEWMTFPNMARRRRVGKRVVAVNRKKGTAVKTNPVMEALAKAEARDQAVSVISDSQHQVTPMEGLQRLGQFVEVVAMFDRAAGKFIPMDEAVLLRDDKGGYWHATRV